MTDRATPSRAAAPAPLAQISADTDKAEQSVRGMAALRLATRLTGFIERVRNGEDDFIEMDDLQMLDEIAAALDGREAGWLPIESAPEGDPFVAGGYSGTGEWTFRVFDDHEAARRTGHTHWVGLWLPAPPARPQQAGEVGDV